MTRSEHAGDPVEDALAQLFAAAAAPPALTAAVLRRIEDDRWRRQRFLDHVFYTGLCASGALAILSIGHAVDIVTRALIR